MRLCRREVLLLDRWRLDLAQELAERCEAVGTEDVAVAMLDLDDVSACGMNRVLAVASARPGGCVLSRFKGVSIDGRGSVESAAQPLEPGLRLGVDTVAHP